MQFEHYEDLPLPKPVPTPTEEINNFDEIDGSSTTIQRSIDHIGRLEDWKVGRLGKLEKLEKLEDWKNWKNWKIEIFFN